MTSERIALPVEEEIDPGSYVQILRRRFFYLLVPSVTGFVIAYFVANFLPPVFQARATILVESQQIPSGLAQSTVTANAAERVQIIAQRLLARDNLLGIAQKFSLYPGRRMSPTEIVDRMRGATRIEQIDVGDRTGGRPNSQSIGFTVAFEYHQPAVAARVASEFVTSILEQNIQSRASRAAETRDFFEQQVARLDRELTVQSARIAEFKEKNQSTLPQTLAARSNQLGQLQARGSDLAGRIATLEYEKQLWTQRALSAADEIALDPTADGTAVELHQLKRKLVQLKALFTDSHPEVRSAKAQIAALERAAETLAPGENGDTADSGSAAGPDRDGRVVAIDQELSLLRSQKAEVDKGAEALSETILRTPETEALLSALTRDLESLQVEYRAAKAKLAEAATGEQMEQDRQAERFEVIEQASVPTEPVRPDRPRIIMAGATGGIALGVGLVFLMELLDKRIYLSSDLERRLQIRPISTIPHVTTLADRYRRRRIIGATVILALASIILAIAVVHFLVMPIDDLAQRVWRRLI